MTHNAIKRSVRFAPEMSDAVDELAALRGVRPSDVIRRAVELYTDPVALAAHVAVVLIDTDVEVVA